jgi:hypothetical protein
LWALATILSLQFLATDFSHVGDVTNTQIKEGDEGFSLKRPPHMFVGSKEERVDLRFRFRFYLLRHFFLGENETKVFGWILALPPALYLIVVKDISGWILALPPAVISNRRRRRSVLIIIVVEYCIYDNIYTVV